MLSYLLSNASRQSAVSKPTGPASAKPSRRKRSDRSLRFEPLEDRRLLSVGVSGVVWNDLNGDGVRAVGEPGVAGAVVEIYSLTDATIGNGDDVLQGTTITAANGQYRSAVCPPG